MRAIPLRTPMRLLSLALTLCLLLTSVLTLTAFAATSDLTLDFNYSKATIAPGEEATITVSLANYSDAGIFPMDGVSVEMEINTDILEYVPDSATTIVVSAGDIISTAYNAGTKKIMFTYVSLMGALEKTATTLFSFKVKAKDSITVTSVANFNVVLKGRDTNTPPYNLNKTVTAPPITVSVGPVLTDVTFTAAQTGGAAGTADSTGIVLTFNTAVTGLAAGDITITNGTGAVTKGTLSGSGTTWTIGLTAVATQGNVTVSVANFGTFNVTTTPRTVAVHKDTRTSVTFTAEQTGGTSGTADSTGIVLTFSTAVTGLTAGDITITNGTGAVTKGTLSGSGTSWTIGLTAVATQGNVTVSVANFGTFNVTTTPLTVAVYKDTTIPLAPVTFTAAQTGGATGTADSTGIVLTFNTAVTGLAAGDITITNGTGAVTKGTLSGSGTSWTIGLTAVATQGNVTVSVANFGTFNVTTSPQTVAVHKDTRTSVTFTAAQTGGTSGTADSTGIVLTFSTAVTGLTAGDITITNGTGAVTKGTLSGSGTSWTIGLTAVATQGNVTVSVANFGTFNVTTTPRTVAVYKNTIVPTYSVSVTTPSIASGGTHTFTAATAGYGAITPTTFTISNTGNQAMTNLDVNLSGAGSGNFSLDKSSLNATVGASGTTTFTINPIIGLAAGTYTATVTISDTNITNYTFAVSFTVNKPALTGAPAITGTSAIGQTLTAGNGTLSVTTNLSYQWQAGGVNIGTNSATYTLTGAEAGKVITCIVSSTDATGSQTATFDSGLTVPFNIVINSIGNVAGDTAVTPASTTGRTGNTITLNYVLGNGGGMATNTLTFTGGTGLVSVLSVGAGTTQGYTVTATDATNGVITITATFLHTALLPQTLVFALGNQTKTFGDAGFTNAATSAVGGTGLISYASSNTGVATVSSGGTITIVGAGSTTITADIAADATYDVATASYTITVNNASQSAPGGVGKTDETAAGANDGTITGVTTAMEYKLSTASAYIPIVGTSVTGLAPGTYLVRYAAKPNYNAGADATVTIAAFVPITTFTITFNPNGGSVTPTSGTTGADGRLSSLPTPTRSGSYSFEGWYTATSGGAQITAGMTGHVFSANTTIYAQWTYTGGSSTGPGGGATTIYYTVTFNLNSGTRTGGGALSQSVASGKSATAPTVIREGFTFDGWDQTFTTVTANLTINAQWKEMTIDLDDTETPLSAVLPFEDVKVGDWFYDSVAYAYLNSLMTGTSTSPMLFSPNAPLTRGMVVTVLYRLEGNPGVSGVANPFNDVAAGQWYTSAIIWAADKGIVSGYGNGKFGPNDNITREQMATILNNYAGFAEMEFKETRQIVAFDDSGSISGYAKESVDKFYRAGIINGKPGNLFDPKGQATRAEFATVLMNFLEAAGN